MYLMISLLAIIASAVSYTLPRHMFGSVVGGEHELVQEPRQDVKSSSDATKPEDEGIEDNIEERDLLASCEHEVLTDVGDETAVRVLKADLVK